MHLSLVLLVVSTIIILYAMYLGINAYYVDSEVTDTERNKILLLLAYSGALGFLTRAVSCAEINYGFEPLEGKWMYRVN